MLFKPSLYKQRIQSLKEHLTTDYLLIEDPTNLRYLTGLSLSKGRLYLSKDREVLVVDERYFELASRSVKCEVMKWGCFFGEGSIAFEKEFTTYSDYLVLKKEHPQLEPMASPTIEVRAIKDRSEIALIQESARLLNKGYLHIRKKLRVGVTEEEISKEFYSYTHRIADGPSFEPIVAFGKNGSMPHYRSGDTVLKENMAVLLDMGVKYKGYCSDMTRMVTFGKIPKKIEVALDLVKRAKKEAEKVAQIGHSMTDLQNRAKEVFGDQEKYFVHSIGHGIGLDVHELPRKGALCENMVITIEPGLYYPGIGGVRLEDMYLITEEGCKKLT
ncbi:MAG: aminopeptidase P family protein [Simkaniaceae bacterium]|nr:aminopeptidase P family protein [Simkaniaceae bacterium]